MIYVVFTCVRKYLTMTGPTMSQHSPSLSAFFHHSKMHVLEVHIVDTKGNSCPLCHTHHEDMQHNEDLRDNIGLA